MVNELARSFFLLEHPGRAESPTSILYGRDSDFRRYGAALWSDDMVYDYHVRNLGNNKRVFCLHRSPLSIVPPSPTALKDFVWTWFNECIVTGRVLDLFERNNLTGFQAIPVKVAKFKRKSVKAVDMPQLYEIEVFGDGGPPDPSSGSVPITPPDKLGERRYSSFKNGLLVNERTWDGSDFFTMEGWRSHIIVTERVKDLIIQEHLANCLLIAVEELRWWRNLLTPEEELRRHEEKSRDVSSK